MVELSPGDFLYQSDQELFLVVIEEKENHYVFAAHGWREIDKGRLDGYIEDERSTIYTEEEVEKLVDEKGNEDEQEQFSKLKELFEVYKGIDIVDGGPQTEFALDDT